ncbi:UPF0187 protein [Picochlorum sp. SENEW3]|nr:UPF0187 protein [Picochlorum sp. SENEW3]
MSSRLDHNDGDTIPWWHFDVKFPDTNGRYTNADWERHRSWFRYWLEPRIFVLVVLNMLPFLTWVTVVTVALTLYYELGQLQHENWLVVVSRDYNQPFILTSFALALLLVFRTNSAYERWWSARKHFGQMYNDCRSIARFTMNWIAPNNPVIAAVIMRLTSMLGPASCSYLQGDVSTTSIFNQLVVHSTITPEEYNLIASSEQPPITIMLLISDLLQKAGDELRVFERITIEERLVSYQIELGCLERIKNQPIYIPYTRQTSRFLLLYMTFLPFSLVAYCSWASIAVVPCLAFLLVGIENIGIHAENPMETLPIAALAASSKSTVDIIWRTGESKPYRDFIASL